ncbi:hypothetical protein SCP_0901050 [Sparassis crispa]|uniref:HAT C-terminal dimerisation domain-containing protein n=1 Tax=Sparassis crispa TaxID=139825 RepID=A0A401GVJ4_9APHY|nr:hypothetical protein SCP_0901050 [Sparassis crispa]GBE86226.1 hypothetical protein SCP_0901050 [Sparassis crispa]
MVTVQGTAYTVRVFDTTNEVKSANNLVRMLKTVIKVVEDEWGVIVIAVMSDCSGESRSARSILVRERPDLVAPDCYSHQINLVVGNYLNSHVWFFIYAEKADKLLIADSNLYASGTSSSHVKTREMVPIVQDALFWHSLARIKNHLEPLAIAANVTQGARCRLDQVLLTFGFLFLHFSLLDDGDDSDACQKVIDSLEMRWGKADQEVFIAAVILNPYHKINPFHPLPIFTHANIYALLCRLWGHFYGTSFTVPLSLHTELRKYFAGTGFYASLQTYMKSLDDLAIAKGNVPDPLEVWNGFTFSGMEPPPLIRLAIRILSICANSASCERLFSTLGLILTKLRTRMGTSLLIDFVELKMHLRDAQKHKQIKERLRRHFGKLKEKSQSSRDTAPVPTQTVPAPTTTAAGPSTQGQDDNHSGANSMRNISTTLSRMVDTDLDNPDSRSFSSKITVTLHSLFNMTSTYWLDSHARSSVQSLADELEVYELLDLDGEGELAEGPEIDSDDVAAALLDE